MYTEDLYIYLCMYLQEVAGLPNSCTTIFQVPSICICICMYTYRESAQEWTNRTVAEHACSKV